jgi:hypothetical protein
MEHNFKKHDNFEQFIKKNLENTENNADQDALWDKIAEQQRGPNRWLKTKHFAKMAIPAIAIALVAVFAWGKWPSDGNNDPTLTHKNDYATQPLEVGIGQEKNTADEHAALSLAPQNTEALEQLLGKGQTLPVKKVRPTAPKVNQLPKWYPKNKVPLAALTFEAGAGIEYINPESGNRVRIPANALVYANGKPVQGAVDMYFREYRNIPDMLAADIPMHYGGEGDNFFFNTGGMFDVRVSQNGEELFMAPGKAYDVAFSATDNLSNASLFYLDDKRDTWDFVSSRAFANQGMNAFDARTVSNRDAGPPISTEATVVQENTDAEQCLPQLPNFPLGDEKQAIEWVKEGVATGVKLTTGKQTLPIWFKKNPTGNDDYFVYSFDHSEIKLVFANDQQIRFFPEDKNGIYTELQAFKGSYFVRTGDSLPSVSEPGYHSVDKIFNNTKAWRSFTVRVDENNATACLITLGTEKEGFIRIRAQLMSAEGKNLTSEKDAAKIFKKYFELREKRMNGMLAELNALRHFVESAKMFHEVNEEYCTTEKQWLAYFEKNLPLMRTRYALLEKQGYSSKDHIVQAAISNWENSVRQARLAMADRVAGQMGAGQQLGATLTLMQFGTYNCDQIYQLAKMPLYSKVMFKSQAGKYIAASQLRLLEKGTKMFLSMNSPEKIVLLPGRQVEVIVTDQQGRLYHVNSNDYNKAIAREQGTYTLTAKDVTESVQSPSEWANLLGI